MITIKNFTDVNVYRGTGKVLMMPVRESRMLIPSMG